MRSLRIATSFLTRIPMGVADLDETSLGAAIAWFPPVGALIGFTIGTVAVAAATLAPPFVAGLAAVAAGLLLTGAFHEDGLADTFDGLAGGVTVEGRLEIMRDSRIGTYGAAALFVALGAKAGWLGAIVAEAPWRVVAAAAAAGAVSRAVAVAQMRLVPTAVAGLGATYATEARWPTVATALAAGTAAALLPGPGGLGGALAAFGVGTLVGAWARRSIGGITGDVLGAVQVLAELAFYAAVFGIDRWW